MARTTDDLAVYRHWFLAAAVYNLLWGCWVILFPAESLQLLGISSVTLLPIWQVVGMCVLVYAPGYWWLSRNPLRFRHYALIGLFGKLLGPVGFLWAVFQTDLPWSFGWTIIFNDLIWLPVFILFLIKMSHLHQGFIEMLKGN